MAIYSFRQSVISGGNGHSAVAAAAYRHAARMERDLGDGIENYSLKPGTIHSEMALPDDAPAWLREELGLPLQDGPETSPSLEGLAAITASETLWNIVEADEKRRDAQYAAELVLALPQELSTEENIALVRAFVAEHYTAKGRIADWAFHLPPGREHNPHVHILSTLRPLTEEGFGPKAVIARDEAGEPLRNEKGDVVYHRWACSKPELYEMRAAWAEHLNLALARAGHDITVDHRSFRDRGIQGLEPTIHRGKTEHMRDGGEVLEVKAFDREDRAANFAHLRENPSLVLDMITRERSTFDMRDVARLVHRYAGDGDEFRSLMNRVGTLPELVTIQAQIHDPETNRVVQRERFTTTTVLQREAELLERAESRVNDRSFEVGRRSRASAVERAEASQGFAFEPMQRVAIDRLTREEGLAVMVGIAGSGKSTVMRAVNEVYSSQDVAVWGGALAGKAADNLQQSSGIQSRTLASWENAWSRGFDPIGRGDVFVIDEAGMIASEQMRRVMSRLDEFGAKVILIGDAQQLQPIEAGAAFRSIAESVGYVELTEVRRQEREDHRQASILFGEGSPRPALEIYRSNDTFRFHEAREGALSAAITGWHGDWRAGSDVVILAHANRDVQDLNRLAREAIKAEGGLTEGERFVTARGVREFAVGERVLFLENDRSLGLRNGTIGIVEEVSSDRLMVQLPDRDEPVAIDREAYNNLDYGYATTIHKSQGSTYDRVHVLAGAMMDAQLSYVALSRHREEVTVHVPLDRFTAPWSRTLATPDEVLDRLSRDGLKDTSLDYSKTEDYRDAKRGIEADEAHARSLAGRLEAFLDKRGLPHPADVLQAVRDYANEVFERRRAIPAHEQIRIPEIEMQEAASTRIHTPAPQLEPDPDLRESLNRLTEVQAHSAAMNHEGVARRAAFHSAENELTRYATSPALRDYAERIEAIVAPSLVVAIGPRLDDVRDEPRLAHLPAPVIDALQANWKDVHTVTRASWELGLLETARDFDTGYRQDRAERQIEKHYVEEILAPALRPETAERAPESAITRDDPIVVEHTPEPSPEPSRPFLPAVTSWPRSVEQAIARAVDEDPVVMRNEARVMNYASRVWREPEAVWESLRSQIHTSPADARETVRELLRDPTSLGDLVGGRTLLLRPDAERQEALTQIPHLVSTIQNYSSHRSLVEDTERQRETQWRGLMSTPVPALSDDARQLLGELHRSHDLRRSGDVDRAQELTLSALAEKPGWKELQTWSAAVNERLAMPKALERVPELTPEDRVAIRQTVQHVGVAEHEVTTTHAVESKREYEHRRELERERDRERGYGHDSGWER